MNWYEYRQNNSFGVFDGPARAVWVQAPDPDTADRIAVSNGVYFHGVDRGIDCGCCGDRWSPAWSHKDAPEWFDYDRRETVRIPLDEAATEPYIVEVPDPLFNEGRVLVVPYTG